MRQRGSHKQFRHPDGRSTTVPFHAGRDVSPTLVRKVAADIHLGPLWVSRATSESTRLAAFAGYPHRRYAQSEEVCVLVRPETNRDLDGIREVNIVAFQGHPYSQQTEHLIVEALRAADALELLRSLAAR